MNGAELLTLLADDAEYRFIDGTLFVVIIYAYSLSKLISIILQQAKLAIDYF